MFDRLSVSAERVAVTVVEQADLRVVGERIDAMAEQVSAIVEVVKLRGLFEFTLDLEEVAVLVPWEERSAHEDAAGVGPPAAAGEGLADGEAVAEGRTLLVGLVGDDGDRKS